MRWLCMVIAAHIQNENSRPNSPILVGDSHSCRTNKTCLPQGLVDTLVHCWVSTRCGAKVRGGFV